MKKAKVRWTCMDCRMPIGNHDYVTLRIEKDGVAIETICHTTCAKAGLKKLSFKEAVAQHITLKWIGKTWSFELPLYREENWKHFSEALTEDRLFPQDSLEAKA